MPPISYEYAQQEVLLNEADGNMPQTSTKSFNFLLIFFAV